MSWTKQILKMFIPVVIGFASLEIGIRIIQYVKIDTNRVQFSLYTKIYSDERDKEFLFWHKPSVNVKLSDGYYNFTFKTNKLGHRSLSDEVGFEKSIVFVGDSIIEGASVENDETVPYIVSQNTDVPAINLGLGSSNTVQEYLLSKEKILPEFNMKMLVLGFCLNDINQNLYRRSFEPSFGNWKYFDSVIVDDHLASHSFSGGGVPSINKPSFLRPMKDTLKNSEALLFIHRVLRSGLNFQSDNRVYSAEAWKNTEYFIRKMAKLAVSQNAKFAVIIFPYQDQIEGIYSFYEQQELKQILENNQIKYFDPTSVLLQNRKSTQDASNLYHDNTHPNKLGTLLIANAFSDYLVSEHLNTED